MNDNIVLRETPTSNGLEVKVGFWLVQGAEKSIKQGCALWP